MTETTRDFTATTFIVYGERVLLHYHKQLEVWLPVGGHVEADELPEEAAFREIAEETGLVVQLYLPDPPLEMEDAQQLVRPAHIILEDITPVHQHIDFIYYAVAAHADLAPADGETAELRWFTAAELATLEAPQNVTVLALEALRLLGAPPPP
ncbi:MAG: NUDIX domain-containing protein [Candidatus Promineifilaceae bacterium]|nr:NUDIX domain-containing protein [Candidatus Promineifilaceae bacterium]